MSHDSRHVVVFYRGLLGASFVLLLACGGSSSETPPPLEPDPRRLLSSPDGAGPERDEPGADAAERSDRAGSGGPAASGAESSPFEIDSRYPAGSQNTRRRPIQTWGGAAPASGTRPQPELAPPPP